MLDDFVDVMYRLVILYLADEVDVRSMFRIFFLEIFSQFCEIGPVSGKADGDVVHFVLDSELDDVVLVVGANGGQGDIDSGKAHVFLIA
jgi:hypothetical protein